ncbi:MAG TPA: cysteine hydrolase family protein [Puia sp.]
MNNELPVAPALILIDIQKAFDQLESFGGERNNPGAEENARLLLEYWREKEWPLFHIRHCSVKPGSPLAEGHPGNEFKKEVRPLSGETVIKKSVNSAFIGTDLKAQLDEQEIRTVVIAGLITQHCVSTSARMAGNYGYQTFVASDATAAFRVKGLNGEVYDAELVHQLSLATINREFAQVITTKEILEEMASTAGRTKEVARP